jgi:hypothetical protein
MYRFKKLDRSPFNTNTVVAVLGKVNYKSPSTFKPLSAEGKNDKYPKIPQNVTGDIDQ